MTGGQVSVNGDDISNNNAQTGVNLIGAGIVTARRAANSNVWVGYKTGTTAGTSFIKGDGRVGLGGEPSINSTFHLTGSHEGDAGDGIGIRTDATLTTGTGSGNIVGIDSRVETTDTGVNLIQFQAAGTQSESVGKQSGFVADNTLISSLSNQATNVYGFESRLNTNNNRINTFNFYAAGDAPNYFQGKIYGANCNRSNVNDITKGYFKVYAVNEAATSKQEAPITIAATNDNTFPVDGRYVIAAVRASGAAGSIRMDENGHFAFANPSDYRLKSNIQPVGSVVDKIKT